MVEVLKVKSEKKAGKGNVDTKRLKPNGEQPKMVYQCPEMFNIGPSALMPPSTLTRDLLRE